MTSYYVILMVFNSHFDSVKRLFAEQFAADARGFIYRKNQKGASVRVSELERDDFVAAFNRRLDYAGWSIFPATVGLILLLVWLAPDFDSHSAQIATWVGLAAILVPFMAIYYWAWNAPSRELERRTPEGPAMTKKEARALAFSNIGYGQLILVGLMGAGLIWKTSANTDVFDGSGKVWLVSGVALIGLAGVQAFRKWRFSQQ